MVFFKEEKLLAKMNENKLKDLRQEKKEFKLGRQLSESMKRSGRWTRLVFSFSDFGSSWVEGLSGVPAFVETCQKVVMI